MTAPMLMTDCPTEETLAAYIDDRLDAATRLEITKHVASCGHCRELVNLAADYQVSEGSANVTRGKFGWIVTAAALAAAAVIALIVLRPDLPRDRDAIEASRNLNFRPGPGRVGVGMPYKPQQPKNRGGSSESGPRNDSDTADLAGKAELYNIAEDARDAHTRALAMLLVAENGEAYKAAVAELDAAYTDARRGQRNAIALDLAAALVAYSDWTGNEDAAKRALTLLDDLGKHKQTPEVIWNRAAALEVLGRNDEAIAAWNEYLRIDPNSGWATEARDNLSDLNADP